MIVSGTGHRLGPKVGGFSNTVLKKMVETAQEWMAQEKPTAVLSGMAIGWDMAIAIAAIRLDIELTCVIPFPGQEKQWPQESQERYQKILKKAKNKVIVHDGPYEPWKMHARNEWLVDNSDLLLALWDGKRSGGTYNCIQYGMNQDIPIVNLYETFIKK